MPEICFITTCMGRLAHLQQTLGSVAAQTRSSCVVVDFSCPENCGTWVEQNYPQVKVVRLGGQTHFHLAGARNLGAEAADAPWLCFFDADIKLDATFSDAVLPLLQPGTFYCVVPWIKGLGGTMICSSSDFNRAGGFDDVIKGWGGEDKDLHARLRLLGLKRQAIPVNLVSQLDHSDEMRVQFYDLKDLRVSHAINFLYVQVKNDLMRLMEQFLVPEARRKLYETVSEFVRRALETRKETQLQIPFRQKDAFLGSGWQNSDKLTYVFSPRP